LILFELFCFTLLKRCCTIGRKRRERHQEEKVISVMFKGSKCFEMQLAKRRLTIEVGEAVNRFANGACIVHYGGTVVMVNVVASSQPRLGIDFFPLAVDFEEKLYAIGKIPGSFLKREGRPAESAVLAARLI
jgi:polyribonucleotide nucleotidyltransferase